MAPMKLDIITGERRVYSDEVDLLVAPGVEGELGILPHHAPLLTALKPGELRIRKGGQDEYFAVAGGFMEVIANQVTVLADAAEHSDEIDLERAETAMRRAQERLAQRTADVDVERALASVRRAQIRVGVARRRRRSTGIGGSPLM
ncbi:MAG: F0F1 ATP synthase subunit epsilon [Dehalococcoidia bacterium]|nr:F0F1 ATP synthase subunit epsilon [Dehalococcoidia bacterium]